LFAAALSNGYVRRWGRWGVNQVGIFGALIVVFLYLLWVVCCTALACLIFVVGCCSV